MTLTHEKTVTAANKAYGKLSEEQKSFVNPENAAYLENEVLPRLKELQENKKLIQDAERLVKKVPAAAKIKASDEEKLTEALEKVQELQARSLPINEKLEKNLQESKAAFDEGMQKSEELRNLISQLDENHMDKDMAALYEQAQDMFDADKSSSSASRRRTSRTFSRTARERSRRTSPRRRRSKNRSKSSIRTTSRPRRRRPCRRRGTRTGS